MNITLTQQETFIVLSLTEAGQTRRYEGVVQNKNHRGHPCDQGYYRVWSVGDSQKFYTEGFIGDVINMAAKNHRERRGREGAGTAIRGEERWR